MKTIFDLHELKNKQMTPFRNAYNFLMALAQSRGFSVRFWGVKSVEWMYRALELGGDGMTCNFPDKLNAALKARGSAKA